jgi:hypothetical protein
MQRAECRGEKALDYWDKKIQGLGNRRSIHVDFGFV